jgi:drug/metabolite transporter (DMT)-like permease
LKPHRPCFSFCHSRRESAYLRPHSKESNLQQASRLQIILAFATIYLVWGSTFLAIRIGVHQVPPLLFAALRFFTAGLILLVCTRGRRESLPTPRQWASIALLATLIFLINYGLLFWAEQRVPSGLAAVMLATIPAFTTLAEILILRTQRLTPRLALALLIGFTGVAILLNPFAQTSAVSQIDRAGAAALILSALSWSTASVLTRKLPLPPSKVMSSAAQMLTGGLLLALASTAFGELPRFHPAQVTPAAWLSLAYLIAFGSILGFTTYLWLLHRESPTRVGTYAYVNPLVAVLLGFFAAHEQLGPRTLLGSAFILLSVIVITTTPAERIGP